jgi:outer membrane biosynthesis protein TonB
MTTEPKKSGKALILGASAVVAILFIAVVVYGVRVLISDDGQKRKRQIQMVTLVKPPPPPKIKEKPPEPEVKKKEEVIEPEPEPEPAEDQSQDDTPPGQDLGLDAEGGAIADGFGLKAKKGGRALIGGGSGKGSLLRKYAWYTRIIQEELRNKVRDHLDANGGVPEGNCKVVLKISLDGAGNIVNHRIDELCGQPRVDEAIKKVLQVVRISEPPPADMPKTLKLRITKKG